MGDIVANSGRDGAVFNLDAITRPPTTYRINGAQLTDLGLEKRPAIDYSKTRQPNCSRWQRTGRKCRWGC